MCWWNVADMVAELAQMIWPLSVVGQEKLNPLAERRWAVEQLRRCSARAA